MKKYLLISFAFIFFVLNSGIIYGQGLNSVHTPDGINVIAAGDNGKIMRSSDAGNVWASYTLSGGVNFKSVFSLNNDVWISGSDGKIYKTLKTVSSINIYETGITTSINSIYFVNENEGFFCGDNGAIYKTLNGGINWTLSNSGVGNEKLNSISFSNPDNGVAVGDNGKIYTTSTQGQSWISDASGVSLNLLKAKFFTDGIVVTGEYGTLLIKENGGSWTSVDTRINTDIRGVTGSGLNDIHICGGGGFIRNNKNGDSRFYQFEVNPMLANLVDIFYFNTDIGFAVSSLNYAIIKTIDGGTQWTLPSGATASYQWQSKLSSSSGIGNNLCQHPEDRNSMFVVYGSRVFVSRNRGESWTQIATFTGTGITNGRAHSFYVSPLDTNVWVAAIDGVSPDKVIRSTDYGATWSISHSDNFSAYGQPLEMDQNNPNIFYFVPDGGGFWKSTDNGLTFTEISTYAFLSPCDIIVMWDSASVIYIGESSPSRVYKSIDGGINWSLVLTSTGSEIPSMANSVFDQSIAYATTFSTLLWKTSNFGGNWSNILSQPGSGWGSDLCREDPTVYLYGTYSGSTGYLTTNSGANFATSSISGGGAGAGIIVPERGYMLAQQTSGLLKLNVTYSVLTSTSENVVTTTTPSDYKLEQNYPNPFNPVTNIKFEIPESGEVTLKVFNSLGKEIYSLVEGFRNAGSYEIQFNAAEIPSGVYFYKLSTSDITLTKKMIVTK